MNFNVSTKRRRAPRFRLKPLTLALVNCGLCGWLASIAPGVAFAAQPAEMQLQSSVNAAIDAARTNASQLTLQQSSAKAIADWNRLNVRLGEKLIFDQLGNRDWQILNRIHDLAPSVISGTVSADGHVYFINANGVIFGNGAQINVGSLTASSLNLTNERFLEGLLARRDGTPVFSGSSGFVKVLEGASISTGQNGRVMLLGPSVLNAGKIDTPGGQTILGAGQKVYLAASENANLRGLLIELDNPGVATTELANADLKKDSLATELRHAEYDKLGHATNLGDITAGRGNVTMAGLAVNQMRRVSATSSVSLNGSIHLLAQDTTTTKTDGSGALKRISERAGPVRLGAGSRTRIEIESGDETAIDAQAPTPSEVKIVAKTIRMENDAGISAPGGDVAFSAVVNPTNNMLDRVSNPVSADGVRILLDGGSRIDVAGLKDVTVPVSRNMVEVELRGDELKDSPLQRNSFLRGQKVKVDVHKGTPLADVSGYFAQLGRSARERATAGGSVTMKSEGDIVLQSGARVNVSGGQVRYTPGATSATQLISADGKLVDISDAQPDRVYKGFADRFVIDYAKWGVKETIVGNPLRYDPGYVEGKNAGKAVFQAPYLVLNGDLTARTVAGEWQRSSDKVPQGGLLQIGRYKDNESIRDAKLLSDLTFAYNQPQLASDFGLADALTRGFKDTLALNRAWLDQGFNRIALNTNKGVEIKKGEPLALAAGGSLSVKAAQANIQDNVIVPGGSIDIETRATQSSMRSEQVVKLDIDVGDGVKLGSSGMWVNDALEPKAARGAVLTDGGSVTLSAGNSLSVGAGSLLDASGGAWLGLNGKLSAGKGGDITLASNQSVEDVSERVHTMQLNGELRSFALNEGGKLAVKAGAVRVGAAAIRPNEISLQPTFFSSGGFSDYEITGYDGVTIADGTTVQARMLTRELLPVSKLAPSGSDMASLTRSVLQRDFLRPAADLKFSAPAHRGDLVVGKGARLGVDPGGKIELSARRQLTVQGEITAPSGSIALNMPDAISGNVYQPDQSLWLASSAKLNAAGAARSETGSSGQVVGEVLNGGSVSIQATRRHVVAEAGAEIDVSGARAYLDIPTESGTLGRVVASDAGSVEVRASEGLFFNANVKANGGDSSVRGGSFVAALDRKPYDFAEQETGFPTLERVLAIRPRDTDLPTGLAPGTPLALADNGKGHINLAGIVAGGAESIHLKSQHQLVLDGSAAEPLTVSAAANLRALKLDAPNIVAKGTVDLSASYVALGNSDARYQVQPTNAASGAAELWLRGALIDIIGKHSVSGVKNTHLLSAGDIRFRALLADGDATSTRSTGSLNSAGNLEFVATQLYPTTRTTFDVQANDPNAKIVIAGNGNAETPLSADGELTLRARTIEHGGVIRAPFGSIALDATDSLVVRPGSLTSVAALSTDGAALLIPYGRTDNERTWVYTLEDGRLAQILGAPDKRVRFSADKLNVAPGAQIDISAGGDLLAYENFPGPGGSRDVLSDAGVFAILPQLKSRFAPADSMLQAGSGLKPDDAIYLAGANGLEAGYYPLLPAHYALLPGAFAVKKAPGTVDLLPGFGQNKPDGAQIVPGYLTDSRYGAAGRDGRWSGWEVRPRETVRSQSEFALTRASEFLPETLGLTRNLVQEAGRISAVGKRELSFSADLLAATVPGYRGAEADFAANNIALTRGAASSGYVKLDPAMLATLPVESLLIGATRSLAQDGSIKLDVIADKVAVDTGGWIDAGGQPGVLGKRELMLAGRDAVVIAAGSRLAASGAARGGSTPYTAEGNGALLRIGADNAEFTRTGNIDRSRGRLTVAAGAELTTSRNAILDATQSTNMHGSLSFADAEGRAQSGGSLVFGGERISLVGGNASATPTGGLVFGQTQIDAWSSLSALTLTSYSGIDFYGNVNLGAMGESGQPLLGSLSLRGAALSGYGGAGAMAHIRAGTLAFSNPGGVADASTAAGSGTLAVDAGQFILGSGNKAIRGFGQFNVTAQEIIAGTGKGKTDVVGAATLSAARIGGTAGAKQDLIASGALNLRQSPLVASLPKPQALGASWSFEGKTLTHKGSIDLPAGNVTLKAREGDLVLDGIDGGTINVAGVEVPFFDSVSHAPGGRVTLIAENGNVQFRNAAKIDVSGTHEADAGVLTIEAKKQGLVDVSQANLKGAVPDGATSRSGTFKLDVDRLGDFAALNRALNTGGFREARLLRARSGDVTIPGTEKNGAAGQNAVHAREFYLSADSGSILVSGEIDASAPRGGMIGLYAKNDITLDGGASLNARATDADAPGGRVELFSDAGWLDLKSTSAIDVSGGAAAWGGRVHLRARRNDANNDVQVRPLNATVTGADRLIVEAFKAYSATTISNPAGPWKGEADSFMTQTAGIESRLGVATDKRFQLQPGIEIDSTGNLTLSTDWSLHTWRYDPNTGAVVASSTSGLDAAGVAYVPGVLSLRAAGNLNLNKSLSDGFSAPATTVSGASITGGLYGHDAWSYRLVAGADAARPDPLAVKTKANVNLAAAQRVRTGSGNIDIAAGGNLDMSKAATPVIYTAGRAVPDSELSGFIKPTAKVAGILPYTGFSQRGGDIAIDVVGDVLGLGDYGPDKGPVNIKTQLINQWLFRQGQLKDDGSYAAQPASWVRFDKFQQGIGALGGGNIRIQAGGKVDNVAAVIPTQAWTSGATPETATLSLRGGGDLRVSAGGNIQSGLFYVARGGGDLRAGDSIVANRKVGSSDLHTLLALGDGQFKMRAANALQLESIFSPTVIVQDPSNAGNFGTGTLYRSAFFQYGKDSALHASSLNGDITLFNNTLDIANSTSLSFKQDERALLAEYPGSLYALALQGGIRLAGVADAPLMGLHPSPVGQLKLLARRDVEFASTLHMSDRDPAEVSVMRPVVVSDTTFWRLYTGTVYQGSKYHAAQPVHSADAVPAYIYALEGDIRGSGNPIILPKFAKLQAGHDVRDIRLAIQHAGSNDVSSIKAGNDIAFKVARDTVTNRMESNLDGIEINGPGVLDLTAGRNIDLGNSLGVVSKGNLNNAQLPEGGASIRTLAGTGRFDSEVAALANAISLELAQNGSISASRLAEARELTGQPSLAPQDAPAALSKIAKPVSGVAARLSSLIGQALSSGALTDQLYAGNALSDDANDLLLQAQWLTGKSDLRPSAALAALEQVKALAPEALERRTRDFIYEMTRFGGRRAIDRSDKHFGNYDLSYKTIALAFPCIDCKDANGRQKYYAGDINGAFSQFRTERGGGMDFLIPGGEWVVGLANVPADLIAAKSTKNDANEAASKLGVVSLGDGDIRAIVRDDILVNQSRILTLTGSGILLWSSEKDIDAGKGKKTTTSVPPPIVVTKTDGSTETRLQGAATGSGIGVLQTVAGAASRDADLFAPKGTINAGDAGIRAAGNLNIGAQRVLGADNISVAGLSVGVPIAPAVNFTGLIGSGMSDAERATDDARKALGGKQDEAEEEMKRMKKALAKFRPSIISVEVLGFGN